MKMIHCQTEQSLPSVPTTPSEPKLERRCKYCTDEMTEVATVDGAYMCTPCGHIEGSDHKSVIGLRRLFGDA